LDLSRGYGRSSISHLPLSHFLEQKPLSPEQRAKAVWIDIDNAFSEPMTASDDAADYVPTQILAEVFRDKGYDAIVYKSQFGEGGFNIAVFNPSHADVINCAPYRVTALNVSFKEIGNRWFRVEKNKTLTTARKSRKSVKR
jgi:hypothetical protein